MSHSKPYEGKYFSILGDSVSTLQGYNPPQNAVFYDVERWSRFGVCVPEDTWWGQVIDALGGQLLVNESYSGSLVCRHPLCEIESYGCSDARTGALGTAKQAPDVIIVLMGLNDCGHAMPLTTADAPASLGVFSHAYALMLQKLKANYPDTEIWCLTLPRSVSRREDGRLARYSAVIRRVAADARCRLVDLDSPDACYQAPDGLHPNAEGMKIIAGRVLGVE